MTSLHQADIKVRLIRYLDRRVMPKHLEGKHEARNEELEALSRRISRGAPSGDGLGEWWRSFTDHLDELCQTRAWPSVSEITAAIKATGAGGLPRDLTGADHRDDSIGPYERDAARMKRGEPVGEQALWGRAAVYMQRHGLIDPGTLTRYRRGHYAAMVDIWGEDVARNTLDSLNLRHKAAEQAYEQHLSRAIYRTGENPSAWVPNLRIVFPAGL